jgi:hypothetical protein
VSAGWLMDALLVLVKRPSIQPPDDYMGGAPGAGSVKRHSFVLARQHRGVGLREAQGRVGAHRRCLTSPSPSVFAIPLQILCSDE